MFGKSTRLAWHEFLPSPVFTTDDTEKLLVLTIPKFDLRFECFNLSDGQGCNASYDESYEIC